MRNNAKILIIALCVCASASSCGFFDGTLIVGSGVIVERMIPAVNFTAIDTGFGMKITITEGPAENVLLRCDKNVVDSIKYEVSGGVLRFYTDPAIISIIAGKIEADIVMPRLSGLTLIGGAQAESARVAGTAALTLTIDLEGGSIASGRVISSNASLSLSGGSSLAFSGTCKNLLTAAEGGSSYLCVNFLTDNADVRLEGGSTMEVSVNGRLNANLSGGSQLTYYGNPSMGLINVEGGASIRRGP